MHAITNNVVFANYRDIPSYVVAVRVGDFDGDGLVDFLSLSPDDDDKSSCFSATVHWTTLINGRPAISSKES